jgi:hypothetical protein
MCPAAVGPIGAAVVVLWFAGLLEAALMAASAHVLCKVVFGRQEDWSTGSAAAVGLPAVGQSGAAAGLCLAGVLEAAVIAAHRHVLLSYRPVAGN